MEARHGVQNRHRDSPGLREGAHNRHSGARWIPEEYIEQYGNYKAKVDYKFLRDRADTPDGKLILVTAITPTPAGEGKTTTTVGLTDGLRKIGKKSMAALREPSLGPVVRRQGRRCRRRLRPSCADGGYKPALHRRLPRDWCRQQPARPRCWITTSSRVTRSA